MERKTKLSKEEYTALISAWKSQKEHCAYEHVIYNAIRNKPLEWGFKEKTKNIRGWSKWFAFERARTDAMWALAVWFSNSYYDESFQTRSQKRIEMKKQTFQKTFGLELTVDLAKRIMKSFVYV